MRSYNFLAAVLTGGTSVLAASVATISDTFENYQMWCIGNCDTDIQTDSHPGTVFIGGGVDPVEAFEWHIRNTNKGDFLILSAADYDDEYNDYVYEMSVAMGMTVNSVRTIEFQNRLPSYDEEVLNYIRNAEGIFFEGGDQSRYMDWWVGTEVQSILQSKLPFVTVGGTSAGLAILGNWVYSAEGESVESADALQDPYMKDITLAGSFLRINFLETVITDTHFFERDRMGRMLTFAARIVEDSPASATPIVRAIGVDEPAGLIINATSGLAKAVGSGNIYICASAPTVDPEVCVPATPLTFTDISCTRLSADNKDSFSFVTFSAVTGGFEYINNVVNGTIVSDSYGTHV